MATIRKILVPTDFSPHAEAAFRQACELARATGASITLVHVARPPAVVVDGGLLTTDPMGAEPNDLWADLRRIQPDDPRIVVEHEVIVAHRPAASHILEILESAGCDLIVMGTHGLSRLKHRLFGGMTEDVIRKASCPVMVVKTHDSEVSTDDAAADVEAHDPAGAKPEAIAK